MKIFLTCFAFLFVVNVHSQNSATAQAKYYFNKGAGYYQNEDYTKAIEYFSKALEFRTKMSDTYLRPHSHVFLGEAHAQNERRRTIAAAYTAALPASLTGPDIRPDANHVFHLYVTRSAARDAAQADLRGLGVGTGIHYPVPVHLQPAYKGRVRLWDGCQKTEQAAAEVLREKGLLGASIDDVLEDARRGVLAGGVTGVEPFRLLGERLGGVEVALG